MSQEYRPPAAPTSRPAPFRHWPFAVPLVWLLAANVLIQADAVRAWDDLPIVVTFPVYDPSDLTALAVRGANAHAGRLPGRRDEPEWLKVAEFTAKLDGPPPAFADRYFLEYPTPTAVLFRLPYLVIPDAPWPAAVADAQHFGVTFFGPRTEDERRTWGRLNLAVRFYLLVMALGLVGLMLVLRAGYGGDLVSPVWLAALPGAVYFALHRFDVLPALATAGAFACLGRGRRGWAGALFGVGVLLKLYPVLFVPVVLRYLGVRGSVPFAAALGATVVGGFGMSWALTDWDATVGPIAVQLSRPPELQSWTLYGRVLPTALASEKEARLGILALAVLAAVATRPADLAGVLRRCAAVLFVFTALAVFWSPQWILWFLPLLVPLAGRARWCVAAVVALDLLNYFSFPWLFWVLWNGIDKDACRALAEVLIYLRAAVWFAVVVQIARDELRPDPVKLFAANQSAIVDAFVRAVLPPRGLAWVSATPAGEPVFVTDAGRPVALLPLTVAFEPVPGSDMEAVPQAREPRPVTAMFAFDGSGWVPGRVVFNLSPAQVAAAGRFSPRPTG